jgi:muramoyltetrapeptide carboxypeptidase
MKKEFEYNLEYFNKCLIENNPYAINSSDSWSDDLWFLDQENRNIFENVGYIAINEGQAE